MPLLTVRLEGLDKLSLGVKYLYGPARAGLQTGVESAAKLFVDRAKEIVPVKTGNLRDHIHYYMPETGTPEKAQAIVTPIYQLEGGGDDPPYARRIEFGFHGTDSLGRHYDQAPQPYMRPAFEEMREQAGALIKQEVSAAMDDAFQQVAAKYRAYAS